MAKAQSTSEPEQRTIEKTVEIILYGSSEYESKREFLESVLGDQVEGSMTDFETNTRTEPKIVFNHEFESNHGWDRTISKEIRPHNTSKKDELERMIEEGELDDLEEFDQFELQIEEYEEESYDHSMSDPLTNFVADQIDESSIAELGYDVDTSPIWAFSATQEVPDQSPDAEPGATKNLDVRAVVRGSDVKRRRKLVHQHNRSPTNRYETDEDVFEEELPWSAVVNVTMNSQAEQTIQALSESIVLPTYEALAKHDGVDGVRLKDCQVQKQEAGECYNL